jgi:hypothetical protein
MKTKSRPTTRTITEADKARMDAARQALANGESIKPVVFRSLASKAEKAEYLRSHL